MTDTSKLKRGQVFSVNYRDVIQPLIGTKLFMATRNPDQKIEAEIVGYDDAGVRVKVIDPESKLPKD